jgi:hypothetical protein
MLTSSERFHLTVSFLLLPYALSLSFVFIEFESKNLPRHVDPNFVGGFVFCDIVVSWSGRDDLLFISRNSLEEHLEKLGKVLRQLCDAGLKVNAEKLIFCGL